MEKKILIAIDDSENAKRAVEFVATAFQPDHRVTVYSVVLDTPAICDLNSPGLTPYFLSQKAAFCQVEDQQKVLMTEALKAAKARLMKAGFNADHVYTKLETEKKGVARGILEEIGTGYDVVVLGRKGVGRVQEFFMGSVTQKVLHSARDVSIVLVD